MPWPAAAKATLHCLTGCAIGEVLGMVIGTAAGLHNATTVILSITLAFVFGYGLTMRGVLRAGVACAPRSGCPGGRYRLDRGHGTARQHRHARRPRCHGPPDERFFWASLAGSLAVAFLVTTPVNRAMIRRGRGHAVLHSYHHAAH